jgi:putative transposase
MAGSGRFAGSIDDRFPVPLTCFLLDLTLIVVRRIPGTNGFAVIPRRWEVKRTFGWLGRWRRLSKNYEKLPEVSETMVKLAMIRLMFHHLAQPDHKRLPAP